MQMLNDKYQDILTSEERAKEVAKEILEVGHIELKDCFSPEAWEQFYAFAIDRKEKEASEGWAGGMGLGKGEQLRGTFGYEFGHRRCAQSVLEAGLGFKWMGSEKATRFLRSRAPLYPKKW